MENIEKGNWSWDQVKEIENSEAGKALKALGFMVDAEQGVPTIKFFKSFESDKNEAETALEEGKKALEGSKINVLSAKVVEEPQSGLVPASINAVIEMEL